MAAKAKLNKINQKQKEILENYMLEHPGLAWTKHIVPNNASGRAANSNLWKILVGKLNAEGPPVKEEKVWRKVWTDQKYKKRQKLGETGSTRRFKRQTAEEPSEFDPFDTAENSLMASLASELKQEPICMETCSPSEMRTSTPEQLLNVNFNEPDSAQNEQIFDASSGDTNRLRNYKIQQQVEFYKSMNTYMSKLIETNEAILLVEKKRLQVESKRLDLENEKLKIEKEKLYQQQQNRTDFF